MRFRIPFISDELSKRLAEISKAAHPPQPLSLSDLPLLENELRNLNESIDHCQRVITLLKPERENLEKDLKAKRKALAHLQTQAANSLVDLRAQPHIEDLQTKIERLEYELAEVTQRIAAKGRIMDAAKTTIEEWPHHKKLAQLREADKILDEAEGRPSRGW